MLKEFIKETIYKHMQSHDKVVPTHIFMKEDENGANIISISLIKRVFGVSHFKATIYTSNRNIMVLYPLSNLNSHSISVQYDNANFRAMTKEENIDYENKCKSLHLEVKEYDEMNKFKNKCIVTKNPNRYLDYEITAKDGICSRCGKELSEYDYIKHKGLDGSVKVEPHCITNYVAGYGSDFDTSRFEFTLCSDCADKLVEFIRNGNNNE